MCVSRCCPVQGHLSQPIADELCYWKQSGHAKVMLRGGEDTLLLRSVLVHWSLLGEQTLRGQQPVLVERLSIPRSLSQQPLQLWSSPSITSPSSPAFRSLCTFSFGWLSSWVMRYKQAWSGLLIWASSSKFHHLEKCGCPKKKLSPEQLWISYPEVLTVRLVPTCFKVRFILSISSSKMQHHQACVVQGVRCHHH